MVLRGAVAVFAAACLFAAPEEPRLKNREPLAKNGDADIRIMPGRHIAVKFVSTLTTGAASHAGRVYLQTIFPVTVGDRIVMPAGSFIDAEMTDIHRSGRIKGRAELELRLGAMMLPNGAQRRLHSEICVAPGKAQPSGCPGATIEAPFTTRGADAVFMPGTTADLVMRDALVFTPEDMASSSVPANP